MSDRVHAVAAQLEAKCLVPLTEIQILAPNALKSVDPPIQAAAGQVVQSVEVTSESSLRVGVGDVAIDIDLQRVGKSRTGEGGKWSVGDGSRPTFRFCFSDGTYVDILEPSSTKRASLRLSSG